jgi:glycosyltransferase involved in cell wall biosynthesis
MAVTESTTRDWTSSRPSTFIQVFNRYLNPGGEENSVVRIAAHLEQAGHRVLRFWRSSAEWQGPSAPPRFKQPFLLWNNPTVLDELRQLHLDTRPHAWILHNVIPVVSLGVYSLARTLQVPILQWLHNYRPISPGAALRAANRPLQPDDPWLTLKEILAGTWRGRFQTACVALGYAAIKRRGAFDSVRAWIAVSQQMRAIFLRAGWAPDQLFALPHSWDIQTGTVRESDQGYFLYLGRMLELKGVRFLVDLWRDPALRHIQLVMAGEGPLADQLQRTAPPNVCWTGYVTGPAKRELVAGCRAVLFPALWDEPLSTVAYEAYEQGKPIVSSRVGGMRELVEDGTTGLLLEPASPTAWRDAILRLAQNPACARRLGSNGRRWLEQHVSPTAWNQAFDTILERVLPPIA